MLKSESTLFKTHHPPQYTPATITVLIVFVTSQTALPTQIIAINYVITEYNGLPSSKTVPEAAAAGSRSAG